MSPYPAAFTELVKEDKIIQLKIFRAAKIEGEAYSEMLAQNGLDGAAPGAILSDGKTYLAFTTANGAIRVDELQISGKKRMPVKDFLIGFRDIQSYHTSEGTSSKITNHA